MIQMMELSGFKHLIKAACCSGLFGLAYPAFENVESVLNAAQESRTERDFREIAAAVSARDTVDAGAIAAARKRLSLNALDTQALSKFWKGSTNKQEQFRDSELLAIVGRVSRRSPSYLVADLLAAGNDGDVKRFMNAFDRLASLTPSVRESLTALGMSLLDDPEALRVLAHYHSRPWFEQFIATSVKRSDGLDQLATLLNAAQVADPQLRNRLSSIMTRGFLKFDEVSKAQNFASTFGGVNGKEFNRLEFKLVENSSKDNSFSWNFPNTAAQPSITTEGNLRFVIRTVNTLQPIAEKKLLFKPGLHRIEAKVNSSGALEEGEMTWKIRCGRLPVRQVSGLVGSSDPRRTKIVLEFEALHQCMGYTLSLYLSKPNVDFERVEILVGTPKDLLL